MATWYLNRDDAGSRLAQDLGALKPRPSVVAAVGHGGLVVGRPVAEALGIPLTLVHAAKLTLASPAVTFGAVDEDGHTVVDYPLIAGLRVSPEEVEAAKRRVLAELDVRIPGGARPLAGYLPAAAIVLVSDGMATGLTMEAAAAYARRHGAQEVTVAVPCASSRAAARFQTSADHLICPVVEDDFETVAEAYAEFPRVSEEEAAALLAFTAERRAAVDRRSRLP